MAAWRYEISLLVFAALIHEIFFQINLLTFA